MKSDSPQKSNSYLAHARLTRNQQAVLDAVNQQSHSLSAQELYGILREQQAIGLATVYRALEILKLRGLIQSRIGANGESLYTPIEQDQHYLTCVQCGTSMPLGLCPVQALKSQLQKSQSFKIYYHTLEFFGLCSPCLEQQEAEF